MYPPGKNDILVFLSTTRIVVMLVMVVLVMAMIARSKKRRMTM